MPLPATIPVRNEFIPGKSYHVTETSSGLDGISAIRDNSGPDGVVCQTDRELKEDVSKSGTSDSSTHTPPSSDASPSASAVQITVRNGSQERSTNDRLPNVPTGPSTRERGRQLFGPVVGNSQRQPTSANPPAAGPPSNAARGPAAPRHQPARLNDNSHQRQLYQAASAGAYSHSNTWKSDDHKSYEKYKTMAANLRHMRAHKSFVIPRSEKALNDHNQLRECDYKLSYLKRRMVAAAAERETMMARQRERAWNSCAKGTRIQERIDNAKSTGEDVQKWLDKAQKKRVEKAQEKRISNDQQLFPLLDIACWHPQYANMGDTKYEAWHSRVELKKTGDDRVRRGLDPSLPPPMQTKAREWTNLAEMELEEFDGLGLPETTYDFIEELVA